MFTFPEVAAGDPLRVSATAYRTWLQCPEQARSRLDDTNPPEHRYPADTVEGFRGSLTHGIIRHHLAVGPIDADNLPGVSRMVIGAGNLNEKMVALGIRPSQLASIVREVGDLYERFRQRSTEGFRAAEIGLEVEVAEGVTLVGTVDAVFDVEEGGVGLVDWKTGELGEAQPQLDFYAALWALRHDELPARIEAASLRTGERFEGRPGVAEIEATLGVVADLVTSVRRALATRTELERHGGPKCRYCPILTGCPEGATATKLAFLTLPLRGRAG